MTTIEKTEAVAEVVKADALAPALVGLEASSARAVRDAFMPARAGGALISIGSSQDIARLADAIEQGAHLAGAGTATRNDEGEST